MSEHDHNPAEPSPDVTIDLAAIAAAANAPLSREVRAVALIEAVGALRQREAQPSQEQAAELAKVRERLYELAADPAKLLELIREDRRQGE
jgi:hypothetical protein